MTQIAATYAEALYGLAKDEGLAAELLEQLRALKQSFAEETLFVQLLCTPSIPKDERCSVLDESLKAQVHPYVLNFLKLLTEKGYMRHFSDCCTLFAQQYDRDNGILRASAVTAMPLRKELHEKLTEKLAAVTGKTVVLENRVEADCLGGIRLELDGKQIDGTVRHRLDELREVLKNTVL